MEKTEGEVLKEKLFNKRDNCWNSSNEEEYREIYKFADEYMYYLNQGKTEKERFYGYFLNAFYPIR